MVNWVGDVIYVKMPVGGVDGVMFCNYGGEKGERSCVGL